MSVELTLYTTASDLNDRKGIHLGFIANDMPEGLDLAKDYINGHHAVKVQTDDREEIEIVTSTDEIDEAMTLYTKLKAS